MNHFTNKKGYNGIRSQPEWVFKAKQPRAERQPVGAYFTNYAPTEPNLAVKLMVPHEKLKYMFQFRSVGDLNPLPGGRGRLRRIFYSPTDYYVESERQEFLGETGL